MANFPNLASTFLMSRPSIKHVLGVLELLTVWTPSLTDNLHKACMCPNYLDIINVKVNKATKDLDLFMRKDPPVLTMDEMRTSSTLIDKYGSS